MSMRKFTNRNIRKIIKLGNGSLAATFPVEFTKELKWKAKQKIIMKKVHGGILIKDWKK